MCFPRSRVWRRDLNGPLTGELASPPGKASTNRTACESRRLDGSAHHDDPAIGSTDAVWPSKMTDRCSGRIPLATFNIADAKSRFSELVQKVMIGEEVIIARNNKPVVKVVPIMTSGKKRTPGSARGQIWMAPDFDATPEDFKDYR
jgi:prevent-host-death family protein